EARVFADTVQQGVEAPDVALPGAWTLVDELGQEVLGRRAQLQEPLALEVEAAAHAGDRRQMAGPQLGWVTQVANREAGVGLLVASRYDADPVRIEEQRGVEADALGRHGVTDSSMCDHARGSDERLEPQPVIG